MLKMLREHATSWMLRAILILVAVTFISWGGYSLIHEKKETYAAKVNGKIIDSKEYFDALQNTVDQYRKVFGPSFSEKMIETLHLREKILDDLISRILILDEGERLGLAVSNEELRESIESIPSFQVDGRFDSRMYERALRLNRMNPEDFERMQRQTLLLSKVVNLVRLNGGKVSEEEVLDAYLFENERINLSFIKVAPEALRGQITANDVEIKDYYQKHQEEFRTPTAIQIQYLVFRPSDLEGKAQVSSEEVKRFYDAQKNQFKTPKRVKVRDILIKVAAEETPEKVEEKRKKADAVLEQAKKTKDFASLAKKVSESATASKGGEMGWVQRGALGEPIESALFSMKAGEVSTILRGGDGFHIFKVEEVAEEKEKSLEEVKDQITQLLKKEKAKGEASRKADEAFYSLFRSRDLEKYAKENDTPIKTTGFLKEGDEVPEIGKDPSFYSSGLSLKTGEISPVVNIPPNFYILKLVGKKDSRIPPLEEVKEEVKQKLIAAKSEERARQVAEELLAELQKGKAVKEVAREKGFSVEETGFFTRVGGLVPKIGPSGGFISLLSSLSEKNPVPKEALKTKDGYFVVNLLSIEPADPGKFQEAKKNLEKRLISQKQEEFFENWVGQLRTKAKIEVNKDMLKAS